MIAIDTNVLLRFLLKPLDQNSPVWQVEKPEEIINRAEKVFIADIVLAELEWILEGYFECSRKEIHTFLQALAGNTKFHVTIQRIAVNTPPLLMERVGERRNKLFLIPLTLPSPAGEGC